LAQVFLVEARVAGVAIARCLLPGSARNIVGGMSMCMHPRGTAAAWMAAATAACFVCLASGGLTKTCGGFPATQCPKGHQCCAVDSADGAGFCCPKMSGEKTVSCAFGIDGLGVGVQRTRTCCEGRPVCGVGVGAYYCCMGPLSKHSTGGCAAYGPPVCCNGMCGDDLCDSECKWLGGDCTPGATADGGKCVHSVTGLALTPPLV